MGWSPPLPHSPDMPPALGALNEEPDAPDFADKTKAIKKLERKARQTEGLLRPGPGAAEAIGTRFIFLKSINRSPNIFSIFFALVPSPMRDSQPVRFS